MRRCRRRLATPPFALVHATQLVGHGLLDRAEHRVRRALRLDQLGPVPVRQPSVVARVHAGRAAEHRPCTAQGVGQLVRQRGRNDHHVGPGAQPSLELVGVDGRFGLPLRHGDHHRDAAALRPAQVRGQVVDVPVVPQRHRRFARQLHDGPFQSGGSMSNGYSLIDSTIQRTGKGGRRRGARKRPYAQCARRVEAGHGGVRPPDRRAAPGGPVAAPVAGPYIEVGTPSRRRAHPHILPPC